MIASLCLLLPMYHSSANVDIAGTTILNNSSVLAIKNTILQDNNIALAYNNIVTQQNDVYMQEDLDLEPVRLEMLEKDLLVDPESEQRGSQIPIFRIRFRYRHPRLGYVYGYRYPAWYWNRYASRFYSAPCVLGREIGDFYYC